jgi:heptosyltransferase-3
LKLSNPSAILPQLPSGAEILILRLRSLGDVALTTPALAALHAWRPDVHLIAMIEPRFMAVLEGNPAVAEVLFFRDFFRAALELHRRRFAVVFNQHGGPTSALLTRASGAPVRVGWSGCQFSSFYNVLVPGLESFFGPRKVHTAEHRLTQFYWTGLPRGPIPPAKVYPQPDAIRSVERKLADRGIPPGKSYAVLRPGAAFFTKRWDAKHFAELSRWLEEEHGLMTAVDIGPDEQALLGEIRPHLSSRTAVLDALDVRELIALVAGARLFVGNDTGPTHIAAAAGCPAVAIFGSSSSVNWRPWSVRHRVVQNDFSCNPCPGDRCYAFSEPRCILSVTPEQVREACRALLAIGEAAKPLAAGPAAS